MKHPANVARHWSIAAMNPPNGWRFPTRQNVSHGESYMTYPDVIVIAKKAIMFSPVSVCLSVCPSVRPSVHLSVCLSVRPLRPSVWLSVKRITQKLLIKSLWNFTEWLDPVQGPIEYSLNDVDPRSRSLEVKGQNHFSVSKYVESRQKLMCCLFNSLNISKYEYGP